MGNKIPPRLSTPELLEKTQRADGREFSSVQYSFRLFSYFRAGSQIRGVFISEISVQFSVEIDFSSSVLQKFLDTHEKYRHCVLKEKESSRKRVIKSSGSVKKHNKKLVK